MPGIVYVPDWMPARDSDGQLYSGVQAFFYQAFTTTPAVVYADLACTTPLAQPLVSDALGKWPIPYGPTGAIYAVVIRAPDNTVLESYGAIPAALLLSNAGALAAYNNLSDVPDKAAGRTNLGLGTAAVKNTGVLNGTVPLIGAGDKLPASIIPSISVSASQGVLVDSYYGGSSPSETFASGTYAGQPDYKNAFARAFVASPLVLLGPKEYVCSGTVNLIADGQSLRGCGAGLSTITCTDLTQPVVKKAISLTGNAVSDLKVRHPAGTVSGGRPVPLSGLTSAAHGIDFGLTGAHASIDRVWAEWNYDNFRGGGTDTGRPTDCIGSFSKGHNFHFVPGMVSSADNSNVQWTPLRCESALAGIDGFCYESSSAYAAQSSCGTMLDCQSYGDTRHAVSFLDSASSPLFAGRMEGGFFGENTTGALVYFATHASDHRMHGVYMELSAGHGVEIAESNIDVSIDACKIVGAYWNGVESAAQTTRVRNCDIASNGRGTVGTGKQEGVHIVARTDMLLPTLLMAGCSTKGTASSQTAAVYVEQGDGHIITGNDFTSSTLVFRSGLGASHAVGNLPYSANVGFHTYGASAFVGGDINHAPNPATPTMGVTYQNLSTGSTGGVVAKNLSITAGGLSAFAGNFQLSGSTANMLDFGARSGTNMNSLTVAGDVASATSHIGVGSFTQVYCSGASQFSNDLYVVAGGSIFINGGGQILKSGTAYNNP